MHEDLCCTCNFSLPQTVPRLPVLPGLRQRARKWRKLPLKPRSQRVHVLTPKICRNPLAKVYYETFGPLIRETPVSHLRGRIKTSNCLKRCALLLQKSLVFSHQRCSAFLIRLDFTQHRACPKHLHVKPLRMTAHANEVLPPPPAAPSLRVACAPVDAEHGKVLCTGVLRCTWHSYI